MSRHDEDLPAEAQDEEVADLDVNDEDGEEIKGGVPRIID